MAMGKNVVATYTPTMEIFKDHIFLARNSFDYIQMIKNGLSEHDETKKKERIQFALNHTWEASVNELLKAIKTV
jgi:hypothetical protein